MIDRVFLKYTGFNDFNTPQLTSPDVEADAVIDAEIFKKTS